MAKHLLKFDTAAEYSAATINKPAVSWVVEENTVKYDPYVDYSKEYLTFTAEESGTFKFSGNTVQYSLDNGSTWTSLASDTNTPTINAGSKIMWKTLGGGGKFSSTGSFTVEGNIMSLLYGDNFVGETTINNNILGGLFDGCTGLTTAENLVLPAMTIPVNGYRYMFNGCTSLTTAPELPATTFQTFQNYEGMFQGCTSLTTAPELPATTLVTNCYNSMFKGCSNLITAPVLPATTLALANGCYKQMFYGCTSLTTAPVLPATTLVRGCYEQMFYGCTSLNSVTCLATDISATYSTDSWVNYVAATGTFTKAASMTDWTTGASGIPSGWTVVDAS